LTHSTLHKHSRAPHWLQDLVLAILLLSTALQAAEIIPSSRDGAPQPAILIVPEAVTGPAPLLVHLHSWSANYKSSGGMDEALSEAQKRGWIFLSPDFRGPNDRPEACASDLAVADVVDAVNHAASVARVDRRRVYLLGGSGGGHMALMMASRHPELWAAVSAWVPISGLAAWHASAKAAGLRYSRMLESCCGGPPGSPATDREYRRRSPLHFLSNAGGLPISINAGVHDGHKGSVPVSHSLKAFNELARANGLPAQAFPQRDIAFITANAQIPGRLAGERPARDEGRKHKVLLRRSAGPASITIFDGGHETDFTGAIRWLAAHRKKQ
jgi:dipeptidyl aminopeptidase/acylaminoacyl peptidase